MRLHHPCPILPCPTLSCPTLSCSIPYCRILAFSVARRRPGTPPLAKPRIEVRRPSLMRRRSVASPHPSDGPERLRAPRPSRKKGLTKRSGVPHPRQPTQPQRKSHFLGIDFVLSTKVQQDNASASSGARLFISLHRVPRFGRTRSATHDVGRESRLSRKRKGRNLRPNSNPLSCGPACLSACVQGSYNCRTPAAELVE